MVGGDVSVDVLVEVEGAGTKLGAAIRTPFRVRGMVGEDGAYAEEESEREDTQRAMHGSHSGYPAVQLV